MPVIKSTRFFYTTLLLLGTLTSTAVAQTIETETLSSKTNPITASSLNTPTASEQTLSTPVETDQSSQNVEPQHALSPETALAPSPEIAELQPLPHTLSEARFLAGTVQPETAQASSEPINPESSQTPEKTPTQAVRFTPRVGASFTTGPGVGYEGSFGSLEGFVPLSQSNRRLTFLEGRVSLSTENSLVSGNVVLGHRAYNANANRIFGGYVAYDARDTGNSHFNQIGVGLESLGETYDFRVNAYVPVGDNRQLAEENVSTTTSSFSEPFFQENFLAQSRNLQQQIDRRYEAAMAGFDVEAGVKIAQLGETGDLRGYGGLYYFDAPGSSGSLGWRTRLEARPIDSLKLGLALSSDATFGTNLVFNVGASFPGTRRRGMSQEERVLARLGESVTRNALIAVDEQVESETSVVQDTVFVTNPTTGQPWRFQHVNLGVGTGSGTFEAPTGTVAEALAVAQPNDIVYVQLGNNAETPAFTIPDQVQVLSTGAVQEINTVESGNVQLPQSGSGVLPTVTGTVTMANNTTLSGFAIASGTGSGIVGSNINTVSVRNNAIANSAVEGILLENVTGQVAVTRNSINNSGANGLSITNNQGQVDLTLTENTITNNGASSNDGDGVNIELRNTAIGTFNLSNNAIANNNGLGDIADGVDITIFDTAQGTFNLSNNQITNNQFRGTSVALEATAQGTFNFIGNTISGNQADGAYIKLSDTAQGTFNLSNNQITTNGISGVGISLSDNTQGEFEITNNTISDNQESGIFVLVSDAAQGTATISNNQEIARNGTYGIFISSNQTSRLRTLIESNTVVDNTLSGLSFSSFDSAGTFAAIRLNTFTGGGFSDVEAITLSPDANICLQPRNNVINSIVLFDFVGGLIQVEEGTLPTNTITNSQLTNWSGTTVPTGTCGF